MSQNLRIPNNLETRNNTNLSGFVIFMVELGIYCQISLSCKLQSKHPNKKCLCQKPQDPMILIHELVKVLKLYANTEVETWANSTRNPNSKFASVDAKDSVLVSLSDMVLMLILSISRDQK